MAIWHKIGHWWYKMLLDYKTRKIIEAEEERKIILRLKEIKKVYVLEGDNSKVWVEFYEDDLKTCYITHLYVKTGARQKGVGTQTLLAAEKYGKDRGASVVMLLVDNDRDWLMSWYCKNGYEFHSTAGESTWLIKDLL